ncbi:MAG: RlmE family RNA methyltransferase [Rhodospirillaceae bacterium]
MKGKSGGGRRTGAGDRASAGRGLHVRVRTARGRTVGQQKWLQRQLNDPYVARAREQGMRSRAAFKLIELDDKFHVLRKGAKVIDLGAAPGGWTQVAVERVKAGQPGGGVVVAMDINPWDEIKEAKCFTMDFLDDRAPSVIKDALGGKADVVLSDMASPTTGHGPTDHLRIMGLAEAAWAFAEEVLAPGGAFICKLFQGGAENELLSQIKTRCRVVKHVKPPASRKESAEVYLVALDFKG